MSQVTSLVNHEEIDRFEQAVAAYLSGELNADRFQGIRLQQGVYGQRQEGVHMVRIKAPGGRLNPDQLRAIAGAVERYTPGHKAHITTRQDIQLHYVPTGDAPEVLRLLATAGLTTREACGNTVRNITASPLAGLCPHEHVDVTPFVQGAARHFLRHPLTQNLPRKFKISFSGCESDSAQGMIHDLGVVAVRLEDGRFGFKVVAGGGLGHKPREAIVVEPFIEEKELLPVLEAVISLHNRYSDGTKRAKSRIKFLVERFGAEGFVEKYREELARTRLALAGHPYPKGEWTGGKPGKDACGSGAPRRLFKQKQPGLYVFPISVPLGEIDAAQLRGIAALMEELGLHEIRTTQDQNLMLVNAPEAQLARIEAELAGFQLTLPRRGGNVVACPGASTCRLGITTSMIVAPKLSGGKQDLRIRVSGCHNGCAQPETGDIGIYGEGRRIHGKLIPHYQMYFGGDGTAGGGIALKGPSIPAARIEEAVKLVREAFESRREPWETFFQWTRKQQPGYFEQLLADLVHVAEEDVPQLLKDHGEQEEFKVLQLGGGECAGGAAKATVAPNFIEASHERNYRRAFMFQRKYEEALGCAEAILRLVGQTLLRPGTRITGLPDLVFRVQALPEQPQVSGKLASLAEELARLQQANSEAELAQFFAAVDEWTVTVGEHWLSLDRLLDIAGLLPQTPAKEPQRGAAPLELSVAAG